MLKPNHLNCSINPSKNANFFLSISSFVESNLRGNAMDSATKIPSKHRRHFHSKDSSTRRRAPSIQGLRVREESISRLHQVRLRDVRREEQALQTGRIITIRHSLCILRQEDRDARSVGTIAITLLFALLPQTRFVVIVGFKIDAVDAVCVDE